MCSCWQRDMEKQQQRGKEATAKGGGHLGRALSTRTGHGSRARGAHRDRPIDAATSMSEMAKALHTSTVACTLNSLRQRTADGRAGADRQLASRRLL